MSRNIMYLLGSAAVLTLAACGSGEVNTQTTEASDTSPAQTQAQANSDAPSLAAVKQSIEAPPEEVSGPMIDPAAENIDPFRGMYEAEQIETFNASYDGVDAETINIAERIDETNAIVITEVPVAEDGLYEQGLRCAAAIDASARVGGYQAHEAKAMAQGALAATVYAIEAQMQPDAPEEQRDALVSDFREQTYINYNLIRADMSENMEAEALKAQAETCYQELGLAEEETGAESAEVDETAEAGGSL